MSRRISFDQCLRYGFEAPQPRAIGSRPEREHESDEPEFTAEPPAADDDRPDDGKGVA